MPSIRSGTSTTGKALASKIVPVTAKEITCGSPPAALPSVLAASMAERSEPAPASFKLVTTKLDMSAFLDKK
jgi:hypothetical protein